MSDKMLPAFFYDDSNTDKCEEVMDYFISWTLRCAQSKFAASGLLHTYAKRILSELLFGDSLRLEDVQVKEVKTWKQSDYIDVWVHVILENGDKYAIIIENKLYALLESHQLFTYKRVGEKYYREHKDYKVRYIFLRGADEFRDGDETQCKEHGFRPILLWNLKSSMQADELTGNDLFDEFWFHWWDPNRKIIK